MWRELVTRGTGEQANTYVMEQILTAERTKFHGWIMFNQNCIGSNARRQLFYTTFFLKFHGLSRTGCDALGEFGFVTKKTLFSTTKKQTKQDTEAETR